MREFFVRNRENLLANIISSIVIACGAAILTFLTALPTVPVPAWLFFAAAAFLVFWWRLSRPRKNLIPALNEKFGVERVLMDGKHFVGCTFEGSELVFLGKDGFSLERCNLISHRIKFEGAAGIVLTQLAAMYKDPGFRESIDQTLNEVRGQG